jgi:hypothetical protein
MKFPPDTALEIDQRKIVEYLLNPAHPDGKAKADFFAANGLDTNNARDFEEQLKLQVVEIEPSKTLITTFGEKFVFEGLLRFPNGKSHIIRSVWIRKEKERTIKFVTAYRI